ncbi:putative kinetochore protein spc24 [Dimargaris cristalligena]|uniref:Kinetochore protein Spc24 n=1 Tax=Dimargaris cristalligena TaxID=215637 RepID=A0A4P9ZQX6_9FUNG|nr:putative kinetochore protein spc24 [Dimargaris cristalligena]RKP34830.1 Spc24 subunit of Ndc80-domain-containing protein [Dimargaris cristalligena]|eukprot:RKP34830.1 Spc24 subunit of Ndc80-domain-containing protein [Dimargaris cristalligena]
MTDVAIEETRSIVQQTIHTFQPSSDLDLIRHIDNDMNEAADNWETRLKEDQDILKALSRKLENLKADASRPQVGDDGLTHTERLVNLDRDKFNTAKSINELESVINSLNVTVEQLKDQSDKLDHRDVEKELPADSTILKLQIYRSLGIELLPDKTGKFAKARICCNSKNDVHTVVIDDKYSNFFYANYLWDMCT